MRTEEETSQQRLETDLREAEHGRISLASPGAEQIGPTTALAGPGSRGGAVPRTAGTLLRLNSNLPVPYSGPVSKLL